MLTLTDVARTEHLAEGPAASGGEYALSESDDEELESDLDPAEVFYLKEDYSPEVRGPALVGDWMSRGVVSVAPEASLERVCEVMVREHIHRVCVTAGDRLVGLITSFDVVRHLAGGGCPRKAQPAARPRTRSRAVQAKGAAPGETAMKKLLAIATLLALTLASIAPGWPPPVRTEALRLGVFELRAVEVAYARSEIRARWMEELIERERAARRGDARGSCRRRGRRRAAPAPFRGQGLSVVSIDDILLCTSSSTSRRSPSRPASTPSSTAGPWRTTGPRSSSST